MGRGVRHYTPTAPICPSCRSEAVQATGPVEEIKGMAHVPVLCGGCRRRWKSQNAQLVASAEKWAMKSCSEPTHRERQDRRQST